MADLPISGLPPVVTPLPADLILSTNDGISRGMSRQQLHTLEVGEILLLPNGSDASTPELQFPNSGVYEDALDQLAFAHAGLQVAHAVAPASGGMFVNNLSTGGGLERVLTTSDAASFGEYSGTFNGAGPTFPATSNQGDWFNCTNPGTIDGQPFVLGDILVALIDSPSTSTFAGNWTLVPHIGQADHLLLLNIGTNTHVQIDNHIADATIHFTEASIVHANIIGAGANSHAAIDSHIADGTLHFTQAAISITASQISDFAAAVSSNAAVAANTAKVTNATHTGQVTGSGALVLNPNATAITAQPASGAIIAADTILTNDGGVLSEATFTQMVTFFNANLTFAAASHTHVAADITDFAAAVSGNAAVAANTAKVTNATHTGDVTGSVALTIANDAVTNLKLANMTANTIKVRSATTGDPQDLIIPVNTVMGRQGAALIAAQVQTAQIQNDNVTYAKIQNIAAASRLLGRGSAAGSGDTQEITLGAGLTMTGTVLAASGSGTIGGSITDNQIAVGAATADDIEGSANLIYDGTRLTLGFGVAQGEIMLDADATTARGSIFTKTVGLVDTKILTRGSSLDQLNFGAAAFSLNFVGSKATYNQSIFQVEQAAAQADVAAQGQWWVNNSGFNPSMPFFTGESGDDMNLARDLWDNGTLQAQATATGIDVRDTLKVGSLGSTTGVLKLGEQANADVDEAGYGQFWVDNLTPNIPMFTNDAGTDGTLARLEFAQTWTQNQTFAANVDLVLATTGEVRFGTTTVFGFNGADSFIEMNGNNNDLFITVESGGGNSTAAAFRGQSAGNLAELYANNLIQLATQNNASTGNTSGAQVKSHNAVLYDVGYNQLPVFNDNVSDTLEAAHSGQVAFKDATTARTLTLASNASLDFPVHGMTTVINAFTSGNYTITEGASTTLYYLDGATRTDTAGGATVGPGGVANIWRESATVYYIWGTGITP